MSFSDSRWVAGVTLGNAASSGARSTKIRPIGRVAGS